MRLALVRHGQTAWNLEGRAQGHTDVPLDAVGRLQAQAAARALAAWTPVAVYTSDLIRARETAERVAEACGAPLEVRQALRECGFGAWEGLTFAEFGPLLDGARDTSGEVCPPGGERDSDQWRRLETWAPEIDGLADDAIVVAHGGTCRMLLSLLLGGDLRVARGFRFGNGAITTLERRRDHWVLDRYADEAHLVDPSAPMIDVHATANP